MKNKNAWELGLQQRIFNGSFMKAVQEKFGTLKNFAEASNIPYTILLSWKNFQSKSYIKIKHREVLEQLLDKPIEELFPPTDFLELVKDKPRTVVNYIPAELKGLGTMEAKALVEAENQNPENQYNIRRKKEILAEALECLTIREKKIIMMRFFDNMTYSEIGNEFNVGPTRIGQILAKALSKLRRNPIFKENKDLFSQEYSKWA